MAQLKISLFSKELPGNTIKRHILDSSKLRELAYNNFKFDENDSKFSKSVENTHYEQFLPFPTMFSKVLSADT